jgi:hypothetical protein
MKRATEALPLLDDEEDRQTDGMATGIGLPTKKRKRNGV